jgi:hypothetical protein
MNRSRILLLGALLLAATTASSAWSACCYFSALGQDVNQPSQKAFITWDPQEEVESFTVQPKFEGNARDFGMVIPTPSRPRLNEMPRDFFKELAVFTILRPMPLDKYKQIRFRALAGALPASERARDSTVRVLEAGVVGSLDYKIVTAERADDLYQWLKEHRYSYAGDEATLNFYVGKKWFFTVMKIDPKQMKRRPDGTYSGDVTPTRFSFSTPRLIYPLRITQISVKDATEALFYVQAPFKVDMPGEWSYQRSWAPMWRQAIDFAVPAKVTAQERAWKAVVDRQMSRLQSGGRSAAMPTTLEWARKLDAKDIGMLDGSVKFDREADPASVAQLKILRGHLRQGQWITKLRRQFRRQEMTQDLEFVRARLGDAPDDMEYVYILPTSPP